jgi:CRISPR-associated protein Cas1
VYFPETRDRHQVEIPPDAEAWVTRLVAEIRANAARPIPPTPLIDSPKCPRCSLVGICLPDETNLLAHRAPSAPRRLVAREDPRRPL